MPTQKSHFIDFILSNHIESDIKFISNENFNAIEVIFKMAKSHKKMFLFLL